MLVKNFVNNVVKAVETKALLDFIKIDAQVKRFAKGIGSGNALGSEYFELLTGRGEKLLCMLKLAEELKTPLSREASFASLVKAVVETTKASKLTAESKKVAEAAMENYKFLKVKFDRAVKDLEWVPTATNRDVALRAQAAVNRAVVAHNRVGSINSNHLRSWGESFKKVSGLFMKTLRARQVSV